VTRRRFLEKSGAALGAAVALPSLRCAWPRDAKTGGGAGAKEPPSFLLIVSDDQAIEDSGCYGNSTIGTPNLDRLAAEGLRFTNAFTPTAICQPSRACLHTGLHGTSSGAAGFNPIDPGIATLSGTLKDAGWRTGLIGKTHLAPIAQFRFDFLKPSKELSSGRDVEAIARATRDFVGECARAKQPFFLNVNFDDPHHPWPLLDSEVAGASAVESEEDREAAPARRPGAGNAVAPRDRALGGVAGTHDPAKVRLPALLPDRPEIRRELARYADAITRLDRGVGLVLDALKDLGAAERTLVLFVSDNGMEFPFHKTTLWEGGVHLPMLARWPGTIRAGATCDGLVSFVDVMPTLLEAAGVAAPAKLEGRSFRAALADPAAPLREEIFLTHTRHLRHTGTPSRGLRTRRFKYLRNPWDAGETFETAGMEHDSWKAVLEAAKSDPPLAERVERYLHRPPVELYDLAADPLERRNLAGLPELAEAQEELHARLVAQMTAIRDPLLPRIA
jgi:N-sulfoglucosamine sulfohydrolase